MYSIGEFSKIGSVSTKTLRYYDEISLLRPAYVDEENRYRYYAEEQVDDILLIAELKTYDLRLEQIKAIMENRDTSLLKHFLAERIEQLNEQIEANIRLRQYLERKVHEIQSGGNRMEQNRELVVEAKEFKPVWAMSKRATIEITQVGVVIGKVFEEIFKNNLQPAGPVMTFYWDEEFHQEHANIEVCVPVAGHEGRADISDLKLLNPGMCAACTYVGPYHQMGKAYAAVLKWIEENQYQIDSAPFDIYISDPKTVRNPEELVTEVWFPVRK